MAKIPNSEKKKQTKQKKPYLTLIRCFSTNFTPKNINFSNNLGDNMINTEKTGLPTGFTR